MAELSRAHGIACPVVAGIVVCLIVPLIRMNFKTIAQRCRAGVNSGGLGIYHDSVGGNFLLCMPSVRDSLPVPPGAYYMRMVSNCSDYGWNQTGSVIRITIGAPDTSLPQIIIADTVVCNLGITNVFVSPFNHPPSDYHSLFRLLSF